MKKFIASVVALALAVIAALPGIAAAKLSANHNQTVLRGVVAFALVAAMVSSLPGIAAARLSANHNQTLLRG